MYFFLDSVHHVVENCKNYVDVLLYDIGISFIEFLFYRISIFFKRISHESKKNIRYAICWCEDAKVFQALI